MVGHYDVLELYSSGYHEDGSKGSPEEMVGVEDEEYQVSREEEADDEETTDEEEDETILIERRRQRLLKLQFDKKCKRKALIYLLDLEMAGCVDSHLFFKIGTQYDVDRFGQGGQPAKLTEYFKRAIELGSIQAYINMARHLDWSQPSRWTDAVFLLQEGVKKGLKDDRLIDKLLSLLIRQLPRDQPNTHILGNFKDLGDMRSHYIDVLCEMGSPKAQNWMYTRWDKRRFMGEDEDVEADQEFFF